MLRRPSRASVLATLVLLGSLCIALVVAFPQSRLWATAPFSYDGDALWNLFVIKTVAETGWYHGNPNLGAPFGATFLDFAKPEVLHLLLIRVMALFMDDIALIHNGFYLFGFFAVGLSALWVLRAAFRLDWPLAVAGAFLFAWLPYHFFRLEHLFLSSYFVVPIAVWLMFEVAHAPVASTHPVRAFNTRPGVWLAAAVVASTSIYYAYFAILLTLAAGALAALSERHLRRLAMAAVASALIGLFVAINLAPTLHYRLTHGPNPEVAERDLLDADRFALSPALMLLPSSDHRAEPLARPARRYEAEAAFVNENRAAWLGSVAAVGFIFLVLRLLSGERLGPDRASLTTLGRLNAVALILGVTGGGGTLVAVLLSPQFRAMNRISVFIAFFALAAVLLLLQAALQRLRRPGAPTLTVLAALLILFGMWDQAIKRRYEDPAAIRSRYASDQAYVERIERDLRGASIYAMPYIAFPETPPLHQESLYAHLAGYLHSKQLRWSIGAFKGRPEELWHRAIARLPLRDQVAHVAQAGFQGVSVERLALADRGAALEKQLIELGLAFAHESPAKDKAFYRLKPTGNTPAVLPLPVVWGDNFHQEERDATNRWAWSRGDSSLVIHSMATQPAPAQIRLNLFSPLPRRVTLVVDGKALREVQLVPGQKQAIVIAQTLAPGRTVLELETDQPAGRASPVDKRYITFAVENPSIEAPGVPTASTGR